MSTPRVLVIEDDPDGCRSVTEAIEDIPFDAMPASNAEEGLRLFDAHSFDVVLTDLVLPDLDGIEVLRRIRQRNPRVPVIIMTAYGTVSSSVHAMKSGAYDYITKPLDLDELQSKVQRAAETSRLRGEVAALSQSVHERYAARSMVAQSPAMRRIVAQIESLAKTNATVLITGESGTGKELVARALHVESRRATGPFVAVNCGALAESLLESEIFGHEKGAFTGAATQRKGAFERADGGTLFLDEVGDAPKSVQVKLLRVLEDREIVRIGGQSPFRVDVRLISASHKNLDQLVASGDFRDDLLYRLKVVTLCIPPLRERVEDIRPLTDRFVAAASEEHGRRIEAVDPSFYDRVLSYDWPGNVRQLRNAIEATVLLSGEPVLKADHLRLDAPSTRDPGRSSFVVPSGMTLNHLEREILSQLLTRNAGNRTLTAEQLGISRRTIQRKIREHQLPF